MIIRSNWLEQYLSERNPSISIDWQNEKSIFEKSQRDNFLVHSNTARVITRHELAETMNRSDCEEYLRMLIKGFLNRQFIFDPSIDISSVLRRFNSGLCYTDSFKEVLGGDNLTYQIKGPDDQVHVDKADNIVLDTCQYSNPPLPINQQVRTPNFEEMDSCTVQNRMDDLVPRTPEFYQQEERLFEEPGNNAGLDTPGFQSRLIPMEIETPPNLVFEDEVEQTPQQQPMIIVVPFSRLMDF